jgi:hypothetical protein
MPKAERFTVQACCGRTNIIFKIDRPVDKKLLEGLKSNGFTEASHFTQAGVLYVDNPDLIITGPIGSDRLQAKCKKADCNQILNDFEALLLKLG